MYFRPMKFEKRSAKKRVCGICGRRLLPFQKTEILTRGTKSMTVHSGCKKKKIGDRVPKDD